jgi:hypothetical protein
MNMNLSLNDPPVPWSFGAIIQNFDGSNAYLGDLSAFWLRLFLSIALFGAVAIGLYLCGRFVTPEVQPLTYRRNSYGPTKQ